jgi:hypothetical protein
MSATVAGAVMAATVGRPWWPPGVPVQAVPAATAVLPASTAATAVPVAMVVSAVMRHWVPVRGSVAMAVSAVMLSLSVTVVPAVVVVAAVTARMALRQPIPVAMAATAPRAPQAAMAASVASVV